MQGSDQIKEVLFLLTKAKVKQQLSKGVSPEAIRFQAGKAFAEVVNEKFSNAPPEMRAFFASADDEVMVAINEAIDEYAAGDTFAPEIDVNVIRASDLLGTKRKRKPTSEDIDVEGVAIMGVAEVGGRDLMAYSVCAEFEGVKKVLGGSVVLPQGQDMRDYRGQDAQTHGAILELAHTNGLMPFELNLATTARLLNEYKNEKANKRAASILARALCEIAEAEPRRYKNLAEIIEIDKLDALAEVEYVD